MDALNSCGFDGEALLREQTDLLARSSPADINYLHFLRIRLSAQQKSTLQRNQLNRAVQAWSVSNGEVAVRSSPQRNSREGSTQHGSFEFSDTRVSPDLGPMQFLFSGCGPSYNEEVPTPSNYAPGRSAAAPSSYADDNRFCYMSSVHNYLDEIPAVAKGHAASGMPSEHPVEEVSLMPCSHCGRTFAPGRLERHMGTCQRQKEREERRPKDVKSKVDLEASISSSALDSHTRRRQLRSNLTGGEDNRVLCPSCGRRFESEQATGHIAFCKEKSARN